MRCAGRSSRSACVRDDLLLEAVDEVVATLDNVERGQAVDANDQHVFVVRSVEYPDFAGLGQATADPPEKAVALLLGSGLFERRDLDRLRVQVADYVGDRAVLPARVHALQHDQERALALCVELLLELEQLGLVLGEVLFHSLCTLQSRGRVWVDLRQPEAPVFDCGAEQVPDLLRHGQTLFEPPLTAPLNAARSSPRGGEPRLNGSQDL